MNNYNQQVFDENDSNSEFEMKIEEENADLLKKSSKMEDKNTFWKRLSVLQRRLKQRFFLVKCGFSVVMIVMVAILFNSIKYQNQKSVSSTHTTSAWVNSSTTIVTESLPNINQIENQKTDCGTNVCTSPACEITSARIMSNMDLTVDPCQDFYQYACGGWIQRNPIPEGKDNWSVLGRMEYEIPLTLRNIFHQPVEAFTSKAEKRAHQMYHSCVSDRNSKEEFDIKRFKPLYNLYENWPLLDKNQTFWKFQQVLETIRNVLNSEEYLKASRKEDSDSISTRKTESEETSTDEIFYLTRRVEEITKLLNFDVNALNLTQVAIDIAEVENKISSINSSITLSREDLNDYIFNILEIGQFQNETPFFNWDTYYPSNSSQEDITQNDFGLDEFISTTLSETEGPRKLHSYMGWQVVTFFLSQIQSIFNSKRVEITDGSVNWRHCVSKTIKEMTFAVVAMYVRQEFNDESRSLAASMFSAVREAFEINCDRLGWLDNETRLAVKDKAEAMKIQLGYPEFILNQTMLDNFYELGINNFIKEVDFKLFPALQSWVTLAVLFNDLWKWEQTPMAANAFYNKPSNEVFLILGYLRNPLFDILHPSSLNFGATGSIMGHELIHGFINNEIKYDLNNNYRQWLNNATIERFNRTAECLINQYSSYHINGKHIDSKKTLNENIADNSGLKVAFDAFNIWIGIRDKDLVTLPRLNLTDNQLFFLSFAQSLCSSGTENYFLGQITDDVHSLDRYRVIGALSNMVEFSTAFQCPSGSPMNPPNKCQVL